METRRIAALAVLLAAGLIASPAQAVLFTIDDDPGTAGLQPFVFSNARWTITFNPETDASGSLGSTSGTVSSPVLQDWVIFSVTVDSLTAPATSIVEIGFGAFPNVAAGASFLDASGVEPTAVDHGPGTGVALFDFSGLTAGDTTEILVVAFPLGTFTGPSHSVSFMVKDQTSFEDSGPTTIVPEPATGLLLGAALAALGATNRRRRR